MKTYVTYGFGWALAGAILSLALYFLGFHSSIEKLQTGQTVATVAGLAIAVVFMILATKARRDEVPATEPFGYGRALGAVVMTALFASVFGAVFNILYMHFINPGMQEMIVQAQIEKWESMGMGTAQIEAAEKMARKMMHPVAQFVVYLVIGMFFSVILGLITSAFLRRPAAAVEPPELPTTPSA